MTMEYTLVIIWQGRTLPDRGWKKSFYSTWVIFRVELLIYQRVFGNALLCVISELDMSEITWGEDCKLDAGFP